MNIRSAPTVFCVATLGLWLGAAAMAEAALLALETRQRAIATICTGGILGCAGAVESRVDNAAVGGTAHSNNFDGTPSTPSEARTAARAGGAEIAANATFRHRAGGPFQDYSQVSGDALYELDVGVLDAGPVSLDFYLPPGFVEIESNAEWGDILELTASIQADIQFCSPACDYSPANPGLFQLFSELSGGWQTHQLSNGAFSVDPSLDTSALTHQDVTVVGNFVRTKTWEHAEFSGRIDLGHFNAGDTFTLSYRMVAQVSGEFPGFQTWAAAAINDPFFLASDPLPQIQLVQVSPVPAPAAVWLLATGLAVLGVWRRRAQRATPDHAALALS